VAARRKGPPQLPNGRFEPKGQIICFLIGNTFIFAVHYGCKFSCVRLKKVFPIAKRIIGPALLVLFESAADKRLFGSAELLDRRFGPLLSKKIKVRLHLLRAAPTLAMVPTCQPFCLRKTSRGDFTLDLSPPKVLRFSTQGRRGDPITAIKTVRLLGVE
jgi:hypothetical protein